MRNKSDEHERFCSLDLQIKSIGTGGGNLNMSDPVDQQIQHSRPLRNGSKLSFYFSILR